MKFFCTVRDVSGGPTLVSKLAPVQLHLCMYQCVCVNYVWCVCVCVLCVCVCVCVCVCRT
jgi:hypothetical protein